ncbi:MAG: sodium/glutamate symporter [Peptostreptococcaceae bacterium]
MTINIFETLALLVLFLIFGYYLNNHIKFLRENYVPAPLIGGLLFSLMVFIIRKFTSLEIEYGEVGPVAMAIFIGSIGFRFSFHIFKNTISKTMIYFVIVIFIVLIQNLVSFSIGAIFNKNIYESAVLGSVGFMGDYSINSPITDLILQTEYSELFKNISDITLYLGVIGVIITFKIFLKNKVNLQHNVKVPQILLNPKRFLNYIGISLFIALVGLIPYFMNQSKIFTTAGGPLIVGIFTRWIIDEYIKDKDIEIDNWIVNFIGNFSLSILLVSVFSKANPFAILNIDLYALCICVLQVAWLIAFAVLVVFKVYKKDDLASYIAAGTVGFSIGIPPSTMSVIQNLTEVEGAQPYFLFIVPPGAAWLITIINPIEVFIFLKIFGG